MEKVHSVASSGENFILDFKDRVRKSIVEVFGSNENSELLLERMEENIKELLYRLGLQFTVNLEHADSILQIAVKLDNAIAEIVSRSSEETLQLDKAESTLDGISSTLSHNSHLAVFTTESAEASAESAEEGQRIVDEWAQKMKEIQSIFNQASAAMNQLGQSSSAITHILSTIEGLAHRATMLAFNAAIEAARAGEHGKGFAVVAGEVRDLSRQTSEATHKIEEILDGIKEEIGSAASHIQDGRKHVSEGSGMADDARNSLAKILDASFQTQGLVAQITATSEGQSEAIVELVESIHKITELARDSVQHISLLAIKTAEIEATSGVLSWGLKSVENEYKDIGS